MIHVYAHPERMLFLQHRAKLEGNALRQKNRNHAYRFGEFDTWNRAPPAQNFFQFVVAEEECVAVRKQHVAFLGPLNLSTFGK